MSNQCRGEAYPCGTPGREPIEKTQTDRFVQFDDHTAIEVKAKKNVSLADLKSLDALMEEKRLKRYLCVSLEPRRRRVGDVVILPFKEFLEELASGKYERLQSA